MKTAILRVLVRRLGAVKPAVTAQLRAETRTEVLDTWFQDALQADDAALAQRLHAPLVTADRTFHARAGKVYSRVELLARAA